MGKGCRVRKSVRPPAPNWAILVVPGCFFLSLLVFSTMVACGGGSGAFPVPNVAPTGPVTAAEVQTIVRTAALSVNSPMVIAVADREGNPLAVFRSSGVPQDLPVPGNFSAEGVMVGADDLALALARTAGFFSNDQAPLSSRTVRFISGIHFPPGVSFTANADLYGIENTNRGCILDAANPPLPPARSLSNTTGLGIITGKAKYDDSVPFAVNPGGVPLFRRNPDRTMTLLGGVGVVSVDAQLTADQKLQVAEFAAFSASLNSGFLPLDILPPPGVVVIGGISLPFVNQTTQPAGTAPVPSGSDPLSVGTFRVMPAAGTTVPEGYLLGPRAGSMLSQTEVDTIVQQALATAKVTRAVIRLPQGTRTKMTIAVADLDGSLLAVYRMHDGTVFSTDVAVAKSRNVIWFSSPAGAVDLPGVPPGTAVTNRTISFGAQPLFPPGIDGSGPGPFFNLYLSDTANPCTQGTDPNFPQNQSGIVFFPGSLPLYKSGTLVGGLGVSGDGVDQDDYVTNGGAQGFLAPAGITADHVIINSVRLPYLKFPRNPTN